MYFFLIDVGSRGTYNTPFSKCISSLGIPNGKHKPMDKATNQDMAGSAATQKASILN